MGVNLRIQAIIETAIYVDDLQAAETFYRTVLGLPVIGKEPGRHVFFQVGEGNVLLAFLAEATLKGDLLPPHGTTGPGHFALGIEAEAFDAWRKSCTAKMWPLKKRLSGREEASPFTFVILQGDRTAIELILGGVAGWDTGLRRRLSNWKPGPD